MADDDSKDRDDLSDEPSAFKVEEMRRKGRVVQSREVSGLLVMLAAGVTIYMLSNDMGKQLIDLMGDLLRVDKSAKLNLMSSTVISDILMRSLKAIISIAAPILLVTFVVGIAGSHMQIGSVFSAEPLSPDLGRLDPIKGFQQKFMSLKAVFESIRLVIKAAVVSFVAYGVVKSNVIESPRFILTDPVALLSAYGSRSKVIFFALCGVLVIFAALDFWIQRWEFSKSVRLTKQEAKQEHKEHEGDPLIKARIRAVQRDLARKRMMEAVKKADVVVTNPTHIAVALIYSKEKMDAPKVIAKGADFIAQKIKKIAEESNVPMVENVPLARALYKSVKVGQFVPRSLYKAIAEVLAYVYKLRNRKL